MTAVSQVKQFYLCNTSFPWEGLKTEPRYPLSEVSILQDSRLCETGLA